MDTHWQTSTTLLDGIRDPENDRAWTEFFTRYEPILRGFARRAGIPEAHVDDVVQESLLTFARAYRRGDYDRDRGRLRAWLRTIATSRAIDAKRRSRNTPRQIVDNPDETALIERVPAELTDAFDDEWQRAVLDACLREIRGEFDEKTVQAFERYALREEQPDRVAADLEMSVNAVYIAKSRVLARLRSIRDRIAAEF
jgi:RNA polymerase sigma factor (sigma-70 family)